MAWCTADFKQTLIQEISALKPDQLPLQKGLSTGNYVSEAPFTVMINSVVEVGDLIRVKAGIFYQGRGTSLFSCLDHRRHQPGDKHAQHQ